MSTTIQVKNYQGSNSFILKMKDAVAKYGSLTAKQAAAVEKILNAPVEAKQVELTGDMKTIQTYTGVNSFVKDIQSKLEKYGKLTDKQVSVAMTQIQKEIAKTQVRTVNIPLDDEAIMVGRKVGQGLKEAYGLQFNPMVLDITKVTSISPKAIKFVGKMTSKKGNICMCCGRELTDEFSMITKMGKTCAKHMNVEYIKDLSEVERFRNDYLKRIDEIGEFEFWVTKKQIREWRGIGEELLNIL